jgi:mannose/fructose/N-acetylgalactosamine-specific phosphotransferase system component IIC
MGVPMVGIALAGLATALIYSQIKGHMKEATK